MDHKSKAISGLNAGTTIIREHQIRFTDLEKRKIIEELFNTGCTKQKIWEKYTGRPKEHGKIICWMRKFGYIAPTIARRPTFMVPNDTVMAKKKKIDDQLLEAARTLDLKRRIAELEQQLKEAEMRALTFSTMVDIAEREFNISIRKKYNTKPSKK